ncbi:MAG: histidine phosphatase family protein [Dehalococcoidia bacterium]|jgi:probable phosphoglycerate mutase
MDTVILIRHAESEHHVRKLSGGWTDTPITELGHEQAELAARRLRAELGGVPVRLFSSDLRRTQDTASHIARAFGVEPELDWRLREFNNGEAANLTRDEANRRWPEAPGAWSPDHRQWPGGETWREFHRRAGTFLDELEFDGRLPIVVTHGGTLDTLTARWLLFDEERVSHIGFATHVTGITVLQKDELGHRRVERSNDIGHLSGQPGHVALGAILA